MPPRDPTPPARSKRRPARPWRRWSKRACAGGLTIPAGPGRTRRNAAERGGRDLISFSCNDYLNLSHHPDVCRAAIQAIETYGAGAGASRLVTGNHPLYRVLETRLARMKGTEAATVFGSGYLANIGIIPFFVVEVFLFVM